MFKLCCCLAAILFLIPSAEADSFHGYTCTQDCSGHKAGYEWAEKKGIADEDDCGGSSQSFAEGCQAYVEESASEGDTDQAASDE